jgi:hypothetical protein
MLIHHEKREAGGVEPLAADVESRAQAAMRAIEERYGSPRAALGDGR